MFPMHQLKRKFISYCLLYFLHCCQQCIPWQVPAGVPVGTGWNTHTTVAGRDTQPWAQHWHWTCTSTQYQCWLRPNGSNSTQHRGSWETKDGLWKQQWRHQQEEYSWEMFHLRSYLFSCLFGFWRTHLEFSWSTWCVGKQGKILEFGHGPTAELTPDAAVFNRQASSAINR